MPIRNGSAKRGKERARDARITPSDIEDAKRQDGRDVTAAGRRMLNATVDDDGADGPIPDPDTE